VDQEQQQQQQQQRINEAAEQFANAVKESYQVVAERSISAQELNAELAEQFFSKALESLHSQEEGYRQMTQQLADQRERQQEAVQALTQESVSAYMDFINSMFSFSKSGPQAAKSSGAQEARKVT
jgi:uncharacterized protein YdiU (UPF0061 family)